MTKIPFMRLSLSILLVLGAMSPTYMAGDEQLIAGESYQLEKNQCNQIPLGPRTRLLPPCPPPPVSPGGFLVPTQAVGVLPGAFFPNAAATNNPVLPPQTLGVVFNGGDQGINASWPETPPNTNGAVGPQQFIVATDSTLTSFTKNGLRDNILDLEPSAFANLDGNFSFFANMTQPRIAYDKQTGRWFYLFLNRGNNLPGNGNNGFTIAVSNSSIITNQTIWTVVNVFNATVLPDEIGCAGDQNLRFDFPTLGIDQHAIYTSFNLYDENGVYVSSTAVVIQKQSLLVDGPVFLSVFRDVIGLVANPLPFRDAATTLVGVTNFDTNPTFGYYIATDPEFFGRLNLYRVSNPGSKTPTLTGPIAFNVLATSSLLIPANTPFQGNLYGALGTLDHSDDRLSAATIRNGQLYTAHTILVGTNGVATQAGTRTGIRWYQIAANGGNAATETATTVPTLVQAGTLWDTAASNPLWYTNGSIIANIRGEIVIGSSVSGNNFPASASFVGRLAGDPLGTLRVGNPQPNTYALGAGSYSRALGQGPGGTGQPWGRYSATTLDPFDDVTIWTIQEILFQSLERVVVAELLAP